jgi:fumarylacetoacetate (FAA) hydrolase
MVETILHGQPETPFLKAGDRVAITMRDEKHHSIFGTIEQAVVAA